MNMISPRMQLNFLGYDYMNKNDLEKAIAIFKLNTGGFFQMLLIRTIVMGKHF